MHEILTIVIEAGVGFTGFAGIAVALSGDPNNWSPAEKTRVGLMLFCFLTPVFGSLLCMILVSTYDNSLAVRLASACIMSIILFTAVFTFPRGRAHMRANDATFNPLIAYPFIFSWLMLALFLGANTVGWFSNPLPVLYASVSWLLFSGTFMFVRILFKRPGTGAVEKNKTE